MPPARPSAPRLDALLRNAIEPVFLIGPDRRILGVNRAWERLTGHPADQVTGLECRPHGPTRPGDLAGLGGSFAPPPEALAGTPAGSTTLIFRPDGERLVRRLDFWPFHDAKGALVVLVGLVRPAEGPALAGESEAHRLRAELLEIRDRLQARHGFDALIGRGPAHRRLVAQVVAAAGSDVPCLIVGEAGTGKSLVARTIHHQGSNRQAPLLAYDCRALPPEVLDRELFGPADAAGPRPRIAPGRATLLIEDAFELPRDLQARLAEAPEGRARLVATALDEPEAAFRLGRLVPGFYYAITTLVLRLGPLRDRLDELPVLAQHALERANLRGGRPRQGFSPAALAALAAHDWPGNLRELARVVDDAHARGDRDLIGVDDIPAAIRGERGGAYLPRVEPAAPGSLKDTLAEVERRLIERALERSGRNKSRAAKLLGINRPLLYRRIRELGLPDDGEPPEDAADAAP